MSAGCALETDAGRGHGSQWLGHTEDNQWRQSREGAVSQRIRIVTEGGDEEPEMSPLRVQALTSVVFRQADEEDLYQASRGADLHAEAVYRVVCAT